MPELRLVVQEADGWRILLVVGEDQWLLQWQSFDTREEAIEAAKMKLSKLKLARRKIG